MTVAFSLLWAVVSGAVLALSYPPMGQGYAAYIALIPLFFVMKRCGLRRLIAVSFVFGFVFHLLTLYWIADHPDLTWPVMLLVVVVLSIISTVPFIASKMAEKIHYSAPFFVFPFVLAGYEWARSFDQLAFPWMLLGNSQTGYPFLIQFADITSVYGVSFWVAMINTVIYFLFAGKKNAPSYWIALILLFTLPAAYSRHVIGNVVEDGKTYTVAVVQGCVLPNEKWEVGMEDWNINLYCSLSIESMAYKPDLIVWPETAVPVYLGETPYYREIVQSMVDSIGVPLLTGMPSIDFATDRTWNSAGFLVPDGTRIERYDKLHMVPFGEAFPWDDTFTFLKKIDFGQANWNEGKEYVIFKTPSLPPFNAAICFESIFPDLIRRFVDKGSQMIVVITNDAWFGTGASPIQHAMISVMRAIECHRPVIRCANNGISMFIDEYGRITARTAMNERRFLIGTVQPVGERTFYTRFGNVFGVVCFLVSLAVVIAYFTIRIREKYSTGTSLSA